MFSPLTKTLIENVSSTVSKALKNRRTRTRETEVQQTETESTSTIRRAIDTLAKPVARTQTYTVQGGDSLSVIAQRFYGNAGLWNEIYQANKSVIGGNPNVIHPGMELEIPDLD